MRVFGRKHLCTISALQGVLLALLSAAVPNAVHGQTAPYVLPYTMSTYAGGNAQYTVGATCAGGTGVALDTAGDGCLALQGSINGEPHDVRVDPRGYVYFIDNTGTTSGVVHRINPFTQLLTIYVGNLVGNKVCTPNQTKYGDGCPANDGVANDNPATLTTIALKAVRGLGISTNGNLLIAGYNDYYDHVVLASNGYMSLLAGTGVSGSTNGPVGTSSVDQSRGIGSDPTSSIVYVADTANNLLRQIYSGTTSTLTATNTGNVKNVVSGTSASSEQLYGPEDAQTDSYGNIYISDQSDGVVMAIYKAGTLPGISKPTVGNAYLIAGYFSASAAVNPYTYPSPPYVNNIGPAEPATTVSIGSPRKLSIDKYNNLYIADSTGNVVWFVDAATGYIRALVGDYGATAGNPPVGCSGQLDTYGDGCPGTLASLYPSSDLGDSIDNAGNLYITDAEGGSNVNARIRKLLSGLNFPATPAGSSATQNIDLHFGVGDTPAATNGYMLTAKGSDFTTGSAACAINNDSTTDCILPITFTPTQAGYDSAMLTVTSAMGGVTTYEVTGAGTAAAIAFDPGVTSTLSPSIKNAQGIALDGAGDAYIADTGNNRVLFYSATTGATTVFAGGGTACGSATDSFGDGCPAGSSTLNAPSAVAIDVFGNVFIADTGNNIIREVSPSTGLITLYAGGAAASSSGSACAGQTASAANPVALAFDTYGDGCPALLANFSRPSGLATDTLGSLYVADSGHNVIRVIASNSFVSAFAGGASAVCATTTDAVGDGCGSSAVTFSNPTGLAYDSINKALLVADTGNSDVRRISLGTTYTVSSNIATNILIQPVTLIAGSGHAGDSLSPTGAAIGSDLSAPTGVAVDPAGDVYIADTGNDSIRLVNATGGISTIAGINTVSGTGSIGGVTASISALQITSNTVTFTAANSFTSGENVLISGLSSSAGQSIDGQMLTVLANGLSSTQFSAVVSAANAPLTADSGTATVASSSATQTELTNPGDLAILPNGTLLVLDSGNNRVFSDVRSQISYNFGRVNVGAPSPAFNLTELNIGVSSASLPAFVESPSNPQFTLTGTTNGTGNVPACGAGPLAPGTLCNLQAQFTPTAVTTGNVSASFTQSPSPALPTGAPTVTLLGTGAVLTTTTSVVMQTSPVPPAQPQYGANLTVGATVTPSTCNTAAPSCSPTGNISFVVDGVSLGNVAVTAAANSATASQVISGLAVGPHTVSCNYLGDDYYAASSCGQITITVAQSGTNASLTVTNNNQQQFDNCTTVNLSGTVDQQCGTTAITATVASNGVGTPTGSVTFSANGMYLPLNSANTPTAVALGSNGTATLTLQELLSTGAIYSGTVSTGIEVSNTTLPPGTYQLTCNYLGGGNYAASACPAITFTVLADTPTIASVVTRGCSINTLSTLGTVTPYDINACPGEQTMKGVPEVSVADGSTTDVSAFIQPTNTLSGTLSFSCSGLPAASTCTFSPTTIALTPSTSHIQPVYTDITLWTDIQPGSVPGVSRVVRPRIGSGDHGIVLAEIIGWPLTLFGLFGAVKLRRRGSRLGGLSLIALLCLMTGSALTLSGCAGPGDYKAVLTPAGVYPVTITITDGNVSTTTLVYFNVTSPGIAGQEVRTGSGN